MIETFNGFTSVAEQAQGQSDKFIDKIYAAAQRARRGFWCAGGRR